MSWLDDFFTEVGIKASGVALPKRGAINFVGSGFTVADDPANNLTNVTLVALGQSDNAPAVLDGLARSGSSPLVSRGDHTHALTAASISAAGTMSATDKAKLDSVRVSVTSYGAKGNGSTNDTASVAAAYAALVAITISGGTIAFPDGGNYLIDGLDLTTPVRLEIDRARITSTGAARDLFTTRNNIVVEGHSGYESQIHPAAGHYAFAFSGSWAQPPSGIEFGQPRIHFERVGFFGGAGAVNTAGLTEFEEGVFLVETCHFDGTTDFALFLNSSVYYSFVLRNTFNACHGSAKVRDNCEVRFAHNVHEVSQTGGPSLYLDGSSHTHVDAEEFLGFSPNASPDMLIVPRNFDNSHNSPRPSSAQTFIRHCKFGPEREFTLSAARNRVQCYSAADPDYAAWNVHIEDNEFHGNAGIGCTAASRTSNVTTLTFNLPIHTSGGADITDHGALVGDVVEVFAGSDASMNGTFTVTARTATTISYANAGADVTSVGGPPVVLSGSTAAIRLDNPPSNWVIRDNLFSQYSFGVDDRYTTSENPLGPNGQSTWTNNRARGPEGRRFREFKNGGRGFDIIEPQPASPLRALGRAFAKLATRELRQRVTITDLTDALWSKTACAVTGGQTDAFGGTGAFKIARTGVNQPFANDGIGAWQFQEGIFVALDVTSPRATANLGFWAKEGTAKVFTIAIIDATAERIHFLETISIDSDWQQYSLDFAWKGTPTVGGTYLVICPNDRFASNCDMYFDRPKLDDFGGAFLPNASGSMIADTAAGVRLDRDLVLPTSIKPKAGSSSKLSISDTGGFSGVAAVSSTVKIEATEFGSHSGSVFITGAGGFWGLGSSLGSLHLVGGSTKLTNNTPIYEWAETVTGAAIRPATRTSDAATSEVTYGDQKPFATATGTNRNNGGLLIDVGAKVSGGAQQPFHVRVAGLEMLYATDAEVRIGPNANTVVVTRWNGKHQITVGAAGIAAALPGAPLGWKNFVLEDGTEVVVPYWAAS